jgi:hypothetical protein
MSAEPSFLAVVGVVFVGVTIIMLICVGIDLIVKSKGGKK